MQVIVFGAGYVGLIAAACLSHSGHEVLCIEKNLEKLEKIKKYKRAPFYEEGLDELVSKNSSGGNLRFSAEFNGEYADVAIVAVGTPSLADGRVDLSQIYDLVEVIVERTERPMVLAMKSTVPPGIGRKITERYLAFARAPISYVSNPEFLREGQAVWDWYNPDRIVIGGDDRDSIEKVLNLYTGIDAPRCVMDVTSAEMVKYASNAFLATKISFINEIANLCELVGADILPVSDAVGMDKRIGGHFLKAGLGYGGSCFPKDTRGLDFISTLNGHVFDLLKAVIEVNLRQRFLAIRKLSKALKGVHNRQIGVLGLAFKPNTDDIRESPALDIVKLLLEDGAKVTLYDPFADRLNTAALPGAVRLTGSHSEAIRDAHALVVCTEWHEIITIDWAGAVEQMREPKVILDGRNCLSKALMTELGFQYIGIGR